ncbi:MAG: ATP-binding protein, partial [Mycobacteriales bacterium]
IHHTSVIDLDAAPTLSAARADPGWITNGPGPVLIDEFQRAPELLQAIKAELNTDLRPGRFVLTGSTTYDSLPRTSQSLTGRAHIGIIWPLSQGEIDGTREQFVERVLADPLSLLDLGGSNRPRVDYVHRIVRGGYPLAVARENEADRSRWFTSHLRLVLQRDVLDVSRIHQQQELPRLLARLASQLGSTVNVTAAAQSLGIAPRTAESYAALLEAVHITYRLPAWSRLVGPTVAKKPKVHLYDSGLASHVLRATNDKLLAPDASTATGLGGLLEMFVVSEIHKQASWSNGVATLGHWRTHDGAEVDLVIESHGGGVVGVEIKAGSTVRTEDGRHLRALADKVGRDWVGGVVLHLGVQSWAIDRRHRLIAAPVDRLWTA